MIRGGLVTTSGGTANELHARRKGKKERRIDEYFPDVRQGQEAMCH